MKYYQTLLIFIAWVLLFALVAALPGKVADRPANQSKQFSPASRSSAIAREYSAAAGRYGRRVIPAKTETIALAIARGAKTAGVSPGDIIALIEIESEFLPGAIGRNPGRASDFGLTQQNFYWANRGRCQLLLGRRCTPRDLRDSLLSIRLAAVTLRECGRAFRGEARIVCYNSWRKAWAFRRTGKAPAYLRKWRRARRTIGAC